MGPSCYTYFVKDYPLLFLYSLTMPLVYRSKWSFTHDIYCQSVRGLEFSPDGLYLAYCSGGNLCVLDISSKRLVIVVRGRSTNKSLSSVTALTWLSKETFHLVCAFQDGIIVNITRSSVRPSSYLFITVLIVVGACRTVANFTLSDLNP